MESPNRLNSGRTTRQMNWKVSCSRVVSCIFMYTCQNEGECARRMNTTVNAYFWFDFFVDSDLYELRYYRRHIPTCQKSYLLLSNFAQMEHCFGVYSWGQDLQITLVSNWIEKRKKCLYKLRMIWYLLPHIFQNGPIFYFYYKHIHFLIF